MNLLIRILFIFFCFSFSQAVNAKTIEVMPPDTVTKLVDKTAALYTLEEGKLLYADGKIKNALIKFREASIKDPNSWRPPYWVGKCHYKLNNFGYALKYTNSAIQIGKGENITEEIFYVLGACHHRLNNLDSALINYNLAKEKLSALRSMTLNIDLRLKECEFAKEAQKSEPKYKKERVPGYVNSGHHDYNPILINNGKTMYFTSRRGNTTGGGMNPDDETYFEDIYKAEWDSIMGEWDDITNELGKINSDGFDALTFISPDNLYGVITLNTTANESPRIKTRGSDLCEIKKNNKGTWNSPKLIKNKSINTSFFEGSASLTADGNTMYFVSDRKGDKSASDIYVVHKEGKVWGEAKPLPMTVNTKGQETTPFITPDGRYLFFSSDGHVGMGGYDVYVVENLGDSWGTPINMGYGINSVNNDTHFSYNAKLKKGLSAGFEITGNKSSIDIYEFDLSDFKIPSK